MPFSLSSDTDVTDEMFSLPYTGRTLHLLGMSLEVIIFLFLGYKNIPVFLLRLLIDSLNWLLHLRRSFAALVIGHSHKLENKLPGIMVKIKKN